MNTHANKNHIEALKKGIDCCEYSIDACQNVIDMCSASNATECGELVGTLIAAHNQTLNACHDIIKWSEDHMRHCTHNRCNELANECIVKATQCILDCRVMITQCKAGDEECIDVCADSIATFSDCANACQQYSELITNL